MLILFHSLVLLGPGILFILMSSRAMASVHLHVTYGEKLVGALAACALPAMYLLQIALYQAFPSAFARFEHITHEMWMPAAGLIAGVIIAAWWWHRTRNFSLGIWSIFAFPLSAAVGLFFEAGTHGRWFIQNEGLARWLTVGVWYVAYMVLMGGALMLWVNAAKGLLRQGKCVVCRKDVPAGPGTCPTCGAERATTAPAGNAQPLAV
ncbi:MAG: hypothetical protein U0637_14115 [Phycisphaerales bacterium]